MIANLHRPKRPPVSHVGALWRCEHDRNYFEPVRTPADCRRFSSHRPKRDATTQASSCVVSGGVNWHERVDRSAKNLESESQEAAG